MSRPAMRSFGRVLLGRFSYALVTGAAVALLARPALADPVSPRALLEVADLANPVVSPDGRHVAFRLERASVERNTYDSSWYVEDVDGAAPPRRVSDGGIPLRDTAGISSPPTAIWSPDGRWIYYRALIGGKVEVWRAAADGSAAELVTDDPANVRDFSLSPDGATLTFSVGATREDIMDAEQAEYDRGIRIDDRVPIGEPLFRSGDVDGRLASQRYGPIWFDRVPLLSDRPDRWKQVEVESGKVKELPSYEPPKAPVAGDLLADTFALASEPGGNRIALLVRTGEAGGLQDKPGVELVMLPARDSKTPVRCKAPLCTGKAISAVQWRPNSDELLFTVTDPHEGLAQSIYRWNVRTGAVRPVVHSIGLMNGGRERSSACGLSSTTLVCVAAAADQPPRLVKINIDSGRRQPLFEPNASLAETIKVRVPARLLRWTDAHGQEFTGQFFAARGANGAATPLFITYYSCTGFLRGGVGDEWPLAPLAEEGISALCINNPPGYILDGAARYDQALAGARSAIDLLASAGIIDRTKVGMGGLSFGSEVTFWTEMYSDLLAAASVTSPGMTNIYYLIGSMKGEAFFPTLKKDWQLGTREETPDQWKLFMEADHLDQFHAPILMQMPEEEYLMALEYAVPLITTKRADLYVFPNEPHQKVQPRHKLAAYQRNLDWFRFWLQGYEDPTPSRAAQYKIWREMRGSVQQKQPRPEK